MLPGMNITIFSSTITIYPYKTVIIYTVYDQTSYIDRVKSSRVEADLLPQKTHKRSKQLTTTTQKLITSYVVCKLVSYVLANYN